MSGTPCEFEQALELSRRLASLLGGEWSNTRVDSGETISVYRWTRSNPNGRVALGAICRKGEGVTWNVTVTADSYDSVPGISIDIWQDGLANLDNFSLTAQQAAAIRAITEAM